MAFGFFKKKNYADTVIFGGTIKTLDPEYPEAEALAVKDGKVLMTGTKEDIDSFIGPETELTDLCGASAYPGKISLFSSPARAALKGSYLELNEDTDEEALIAAISEYFTSHPEADCSFAVGLNRDLVVKEDRESSVKAITELKEKLSEAFPDKFVIILCDNGLTMIINDAAENTAQEIADEIGLENITPAFIVNNLVTTDINLIIRQMFEEAEKMAKEGITSCYCSEKYSFIQNYYQDALFKALGENMIKQRFFGSYTLETPMPADTVMYMLDRKHTACTELSGEINYHTLEIRFSVDESSDCYMPEDYIKALADRTADKGYSVRFLPLDEASALFALDSAGDLSVRYKKQSFSVVHTYDLSEDKLADVYTGDAYQLKEDAVFTAEEQAAILAAPLAGTLEIGKWADLTVEKDGETVMTILGGKTVYDKERDSASRWTESLCEKIDISEFEEAEEE